MDSEPPFVPRPGQVDLTHARYCPTLHCVIRHRDTILLVKRPEAMRIYPGRWAGITGFLDDARTLEEKALEELREEIGVENAAVTSLRPGRVFELPAPEYGKVWIIHPVLVELASTKIALNWEGEAFAWAPIPEIGRYDCMPGFVEMARELLQ